MNERRRSRSPAAAPTIGALAIAAAAIGLAGGGHAAAIGSQAGNSAPVVSIVRPAAGQALRRSAPTRYAITVSDREDGESASGEIAPHAILLDVDCRRQTERGGPPGRTDEPGLDVVRSSGCFTCHADKTSLVGPSFSAIAERYGAAAGALQPLAAHIRNGSSGAWGAAAMPPHAQLSEDEALAAASFIVAQGGRRDRWLYAGADGVIRIADLPADSDAGTCTLTASYLDAGIGGVAATRKRGEQSVTLAIE